MSERKAEPVARTSADLNAERRAMLRQLFPEAFVEGKFDAEKLRVALGEGGAAGAERFTFTWAGRADALATLQTPSRATLVPCAEESVAFDTTRHLFVEGDNLEVLKLLYKAYAGKVKLIYIDPPYNTGQDFIYPDNFTDPLSVYLRLTGQQDESGNRLTSNPETSGRYHSAWLSMMYPRLFLARQLLRDDGVIFVSIDDHEVHHLRMVMNDLFGEENFVGQLVWKSRKSEDSRAVTGLSGDHEYVLCFRRSEDGMLKGVEKDITKFSNPDDDPRGPWRSADMTGLATQELRPNLHYELIDPNTGINYGCPTKGWRYEKSTMKKKIEEGRILWPELPQHRPRHKLFLNETQSLFKTLTSVITETTTADGTRDYSTLLGNNVFGFPKPTALLKLLISQCESENLIVVDFFSGSCTAAQAVLEMNHVDGGNRKFVMVQLPEKTGDKTYPTIAEIGKERIRRVITKLQEDNEQMIMQGGANDGSPEDLGFKVFKLAESHFETWRGTDERDLAQYQQTMSLFSDPLRVGWTPEGVLWEVALKEGYGLNSVLEPLDCPLNQVWRVRDPEKEPPQSFRACLDETLHPDLAKALGLGEDDLFVCRDRALDDTLAANLALQCRLKTI